MGQGVRERKKWQSFSSPLWSLCTNFKTVNQRLAAGTASRQGTWLDSTPSQSQHSWAAPPGSGQCGGLGRAERNTSSTPTFPPGCVTSSSQETYLKPNFLYSTSKVLCCPFLINASCPCQCPSQESESRSRTLLSSNSPCQH